MMNKSRKTQLVLIGCTLVAGVSAFGQAANPQTWQSGGATRMSQGLSIRGGTATLDQALGLLVPSPFQIRLDQAIPRSMSVTWSDAPDWMTALRQALAPAGLKISPDWANNIVAIGAGTMAAAPATTAAPFAVTSPVAMAGVANGASAGASRKAQPVEEVIIPASKVAHRYELKASDMTLKNTFLRWGESEGRQVNWLLQSELPIDASGPVEAGNLAEAMTKVAQAFVNKATPFVIREYDNTIVIQPRLSARQ